MSYSKTIVCFANSRKGSGRCIVGKEWINGKVGEWIRPVPNKDYGLSEEDRSYEDGSEPQLLDIMTVKFEKPLPSEHQKENHLIDQKHRWRKDGMIGWSDINGCIDRLEVIWWLGESSTSKVKDRISPQLNSSDVSIYLIRVSRLDLYVGPKSDFPDARRAVQDVFLCISLTEPYKDHHYKLIAAILWKGRSE